MVRTMCNNEAKNIGKLFNRVSAEFVKISKVHHDIKKELELCDYRINNCEGDIGYKMLIKPHYSFLRKLKRPTAPPSTLHHLILILNLMYNLTEKYLMYLPYSISSVHSNNTLFVTDIIAQTIGKYNQNLNF